MLSKTYLGLGSNLGDRAANLRRAVELLDAGARIIVTRTSRIYETEPLGKEDQPWFLNQVVEAKVELTPRELLQVTQSVEKALGRVRGERWGPRSIDMDILTFDSLSVDEPELTIPHPRLLERAFVLVPLLELAPDLEIKALPVRVWLGRLREQIEYNKKVLPWTGDDVKIV